MNNTIELSERDHYIHIPSFWPIVDSKNHWVSTEDCLFYSARYQRIFRTPAGAINDLASIPSLFRGIFNINGPTRIAASNHDYRYWKKGILDEAQLSREEVDQLFLDEMLVSMNMLYNGYSDRAKFYMLQNNVTDCFNTVDPVVPVFQAKVIHKAVRLGGGSHFG